MNILLRAKAPTSQSTGTSAELRQQLTACKDPKTRGKLVAALKTAVQSENAARAASEATKRQKRADHIANLAGQLRTAKTPAQKKSLLNQIQEARAN